MKSYTTYLTVLFGATISFVYSSPLHHDSKRTINNEAYKAQTPVEVVDIMEKETLRRRVLGSTQCSTLQKGIDYTGQDIGSAASPTADGCCEICNKTSDCKAFSWSNYKGGTCWLKKSKGAAVQKSGVTSGTLNTDNPICGEFERDVWYTNVDFIGSAPGNLEDCCDLCQQYFDCNIYQWYALEEEGNLCSFYHRKGDYKSYWSDGIQSAPVINDAVRPKGCGKIEFNTDYVGGGDIGSVSSAHYDGCCSLCQQYPGCKAYSWSDYNGGTCWFKDGIYLKVARPQVYSGTAVNGVEQLDKKCGTLEQMDYSGTDIGNVANPTPYKCCDLCQQFSGCKAYTWTDYNGGTCWLKSSRGYSIAANRGVVSGMIWEDEVEPKYCNEIETNIDYEGEDIRFLVAQSIYDCCGYCRWTPGCVGYSFNDFNGGTCWLKGSVTGKKSANNVSSGTINVL